MLDGLRDVLNPAEDLMITSAKILMTRHTGINPFCHALCILVHGIVETKSLVVEVSFMPASHLARSLPV